MKPSYWIIDTDTSGVLSENHQARGPYKSVEACEKFLKDECMEMFIGSDASVDDDHSAWAAPVHIVKVIKTVRQCPVVSIKVELREEK